MSKKMSAAALNPGQEDIVTDSDGLGEGAGGQSGSGKDEYVDPREAMLESIADRVDEERSLNDDNELDDDRISQEDSDDGEDDELDDDDKTVNKDGEDDEDKGKAPVTHHVLDVNGKQVIISDEEYKANAQMYYASRQKLTEASELLKTAKELAATFQQQQTAQQASDQGKDSGAQAIDFDPAEFIRKIREGDDEEAMEAAQSLAQVFAGGKKSPDIDAKALIDQAFAEREAKAAEDAQAAEDEAFDAAEAKFKQDFAKDISSSPEFFDLAAMEDGKLAKDPEWKNKPFEERLHEAGNRAREWVKLRVGKEKAQGRQDRKERQVPRKTGGLRKDLDQQDQEETTQDVIAEMKASRGQVL